VPTAMNRLVILILVLGACRDEQAGPKPRGAPPAQQNAQNPQAGQQQAQPQNAGNGQVRSLDAIPPQVHLAVTGGGTWADGAVTYLGTMVEPQVLQGGQPVRLTHFFRAEKEPPKGWKFFAHVIDAQSGQMVVNADHEVQQGNAPLETWPVGRIVFDQHVLTLPDSAQPMRVAIGFWQGDQRLKIDQPNLSDGNGRMLGPELKIASQALPEYHVPKTAKPPVIDGKLDDAVWANAPAVTLTRSFDGSPATRRTVARLLYDDQNIYVSFDCEDPDVWGTKRNKDDDIYNEEAVEIFLDANGDGASYNELELSPHNVQFDASFVTRRSDLPTAMKWESGMTTNVQVKGTIDNDSDKDEGWTGEMQIPIANLNSVPHVPPQKGDVWRFNLYRLEHIVRLKNIEGQSFSPLYQGDFHNLPRFGKLIFE
jgi:hypothetical protein